MDEYKLNLLGNLLARFCAECQEKDACDCVCEQCALNAGHEFVQSKRSLIAATDAQAQICDANGDLVSCKVIPMKNQSSIEFISNTSTSKWIVEIENIYPLSATKNKSGSEGTRSHTTQKQGGKIL